MYLENTKLDNRKKIFNADICFCIFNNLRNYK